MNVVGEICDITVQFGGLRAVSDASLQIERGTVMGLIGPNGAGKSTIFNVISGHQQVSTGSVFLFGNDVTQRSAYERARMGLARTFQTSRLVESMTVLENIALGLDHESRWSSSRRADEGVRERARLHLAELGLHEVSAEIAQQLPAGLKRRVEVARTVASGAQLVLLDEPGASLAPSEQEALATMLRTLARHGRSVLLADHDMDFVFRACDAVNVLNFGQLIALGTPAEIAANRNVQDAYLGTA